MAVSTKILNLETKGNLDIVDLTARVSDAIEISGMTSGLINVFVPGATGSITTVENESGLLHDLKHTFDRLIPENVGYEHNERWGTETDIPMFGRLY